MERLERIKRIRQMQEQANILRLRGPVQGPAETIGGSGGVPPTSGLANLGNTCYMNAVFQCLRHCRPLLKYLFGPGFQKDRTCFTSKRPMDLAFVSEFRELLRQLETNAPRSAVPKEFHRLLVLFNPSFSGYQQADAQECINTILQVLHNGLMVNVRILNNPGVGQSDAIQLQRVGNGKYANHIQKNGYSAIEEIFGSQFLSTLVCQSCGHVSHTHDAYTLVPVPIPDRALTLYDCIDEFIRPEMVDQISCERCCTGPNANAKITATKQMSFWSLPQVFVIQLKRFDHISGQLRKIDKFIQAPAVLNMSGYVTHPRFVDQIQRNPGALQLYDLRGVVCHSGQLNGGHYTSKCWRPNPPPSQQDAVPPSGSGTWIDFNDTATRVIGDDSAVLQSNQNYVFFYEMTDSTKSFWGK